MTHGAITFLVILMGVLSETWQVWVIVAGGVLWAYSCEKNRQRQQKIIEILREIRRKLE